MLKNGQILFFFKHKVWKWLGFVMGHGELHASKLKTYKLVSCSPRYGVELKYQLNTQIVSFGFS